MQTPQRTSQGKKKAHPSRMHEDDDDDDPSGMA